MKHTQPPYTRWFGWLLACLALAACGAPAPPTGGPVPLLRLQPLPQQAFYLRQFAQRTGLGYNGPRLGT